MAKVVVVGSCMTDLVSYTSRLPTAGETIHGHKFAVGFGGKGANQCVAATKLGAKTAMIAKVGDDSFGHNHLKNFSEHGVDVRQVGVTKEAATGAASIVVIDSGENSIVIVGGANQKLTSEDVNKAEEIIKGSSVVVCQGEIPSEVTLTALQLARKFGVKTLMNAAPADVNLPATVIQNSDILCVNETETEILTKKTLKTIEDAYEASKTLLSMGCGSVIVTLGKDGAIYATEGRHFHITTESVTPVDTTGAGDAFVGSLAYYLAYHPELSMEEMMRRSCQVATISTQTPGTQSSYPAKDILPASLFL